MNPSAGLLFITWIVVALIVACPVASVYLWLQTRDVRDEIWLIAAPLVTVGILGYMSFFAFLAQPVIGKAFSFASIFATGAYVCIGLRARRSILRFDGAAVSAGLGLSVGLFYLAILYLPVLGQTYFDQSAFRFIHRLPFDSVIPAITGDRLFAAEPLRPFILDWLSSDRPPLQAGIYLLVLPWLKLLHLPAGLGYQCVATLIQLFWIPAAWLLSRMFLAGRTAAIGAVLMVATTGFFVINSVYVWPKLLAASYVVFAALLAVASKEPPTKSSLLLAASASAMAWLAHGSAAFSLLALVPIWLFRRYGKWKSAFVSLGLFVLLLLPWTAYQKFYDPPGDRLLKWHLAGVIPPDTRSFPQALQTAYAALSWKEWLAGKRENIRVLTSGSFGHVANVFTSISKERRSDEFFYLFRAIGILNVAWLAWPVVWCFYRRSLPNASTWWTMLAWFILTLLIWVVAIFIPGSTLLHHGSYAAMLIVCTLASVLIIHLPRVILAAVLAWHVIYFTATWLLYFGAAPVNYNMISLMALATLCAAAVAIQQRRCDQRQTASDRQKVLVPHHR